jgi:hypothetical protein
MGGKRCVYRAGVRKPKEKKPLGKCKHRWEHNIKMDFQEVDWEDIDWVDLAQGWVMNLRVP